MQQRSVTDTYDHLRKTYSEQYAAVSRQHNRLSFFRLLAVLGVITCIGLYIRSGQGYLPYLAVSLAIIFMLLLQWHQRLAHQKTFLKNLADINAEELSYLKKEALPFGDGKAYMESTHAYAADLDLFGKQSLYQHLNRTATQMGKDRLADALLHLLPEEEIKRKQDAVAEWSKDLKGRQDLYALARMAGDNKQIYNRLVTWTETEEPPVAKTVLALAWLLPLALAVLLIVYFVSGITLYWDIALRLLPVNLLVFSFQLPKIRKAIAGADKANEILREYAAILLRVEQASFSGEHLVALQQQLKTNGTNASMQIKKLAAIYAGLENVNNPFAAVAMNGLYLNHIHALHKLNRWKKTYASSIRSWLAVIGELEMLGSLANLNYNNPGFCFPELNCDHRITFQQLGHPLIDAEKRVCNDVSFDRHRFMILTGSNMSGKSTFLRTLGINMVLTGMGSSICAAAAQVHPMSIFVSMRQADSLADNESYFFAEVKRLKYIMSQLDKAVCFVLLDEILRGTNSEDKRSGTIGVIEKIIAKRAIGAIATHDLEVCLTTDAHPGILINKCFEVEIINNELYFDYTLRDGLCRNKSATFLMKKMEII
jgi:hypothetical protein